MEKNKLEGHMLGKYNIRITSEDNKQILYDESENEKDSEYENEEYEQ